MQPICIVFGDNSKCLIFNQIKTINREFQDSEPAEFIHMTLKADDPPLILFDSDDALEIRDEGQKPKGIEHSLKEA